MRQSLTLALLAISLSLPLWANTEELEDSDLTESVLAQELSTVEEGQREFDHLVESTIDVMGPQSEPNQSVEQ